MSAASAMRSLSLILAAAVALAACSDKKEHEAPPAAPEPSTALEGALDIVAWPGYIERGENDKAYDWVSKFEGDTGCKVTVKEAATSDEMVSLMTAGGSAAMSGDGSWPPAGSSSYDLVTASGDASLRLIRGGTVQPVDISKIPGYGAIDARLQGAAWHFVDGKHYGVPYQWGPNVLMYRTDTFKSPPMSWSVVFEEQKLPDGKSNKGRVEAYKGAIYIADAALYLMAKKPDLGIKDPYELNEAQYTAVLELLRGQRQLVPKYWSEALAQVQDFQNEGIVASTSWPYQVNTALANKAPIASTIPAEGATGWADTTMLAAGAKHPNCAYKWLEWSISKKVQGDVAAWFGSNPVVRDACVGNELLGAEGCKTNGIDNFEKIKFWRTPEAKCASHPEGCVPYSRWSTDYIAVQGSK